MSIRPRDLLLLAGSWFLLTGCGPKAPETSGPKAEPKRDFSAVLTAGLCPEGDALDKLRKYGDAVAVYRKALAATDKAQDAKRWAGLAGDTGMALLTVKEWKEAEALIRESLSLCEAHYGRESAETARALHQWGAVLLRTGRYQEAEEPLRRGLKMGTQACGEKHPLVGDITFSLANMFVYQNVFPMAEVFYSQAQEIYTAAFGENHRLIADTAHGLGMVYQSTKSPVKAEEQFRRAVAVAGITDGKDNPALAYMHHNLSRALLDLRRYGEAEVSCRRALELAVAPAAGSSAALPPDLEEELSDYVRTYRAILEPMGLTRNQIIEKTLTILAPLKGRK